MRKALALIIFVIAFSTAVYAENETAPDPCAGVTCSTPSPECDGSSVKTYSTGSCSNGQCSYPSSLTACPNGCENGACKSNFCDIAGAPAPVTKTCPDGFTATCTPVCDRAAQAFSSCEPSCAGHETAPSSGGSGGGGANASNPCATVTCTTPPANTCNGNFVRIFSSPGACNNGVCSYPETGYACQNGCSNGVCNPGNATGSGSSSSECSSGETSSKTCPNGMQYMDRNCVDGKWVYVNYFQDPCTATTNSTAGGGGGAAGPLCEAVQTRGVDASGQCSTFPSTCLPPGWTRVDACPARAQCPTGCECKYDNAGNITGTYCTSVPNCNYNNVCDKNEDSSCKDCIGGDCPTSRQCPDGSSVGCSRTETGCACGQCPLQEIPPGCHQESDGGFTRVVCDKRECKPTAQDVRLKCVDSGGFPRFGKDSSGCETFQCDFGGERTNSPVFAGRANCPSAEAVIESLEKCRDLGLPGVIGFEGGCKIGKCVQQHEEQRCKPVERSEVDGCRSNGGIPRAAFDEEGCKIMKCEQTSEGCERDLPKEAYDRCADEGGQLVVRRSQDGCVSYSNCVRRGNAEESFVEEIDEIPDTTELLSIAFKLEELKLEFDKLAKKTNDIAEYYKSTGSAEESRFRRVSDMFSSAENKVDEVKTKIRDRARDIDKDDVLEIKQDLRYLKDVVLKDILFMMLGSGEEIDEIESGATKQCGTDESCFDKAFRVCQPLTFRPDGRDGPLVEVTGLEGDACVMNVRMEEGQGPPGGPYSMTCKIQKYSLGVSDPEKDIFPYCSGNLLDVIKKYGTEGPGVPGKCSGDSCKEYCGKGPTEAKECLEHLGDVLPPEAKEQLTALAEGRSSGGFGGSGGRNFRDEQPRDDFRDEGQFRDEFRGEFGDEFGDDFGSSPGNSGSGGCSGCLNNGVCDPGECPDCNDCRRR